MRKTLFFFIFLILTIYNASATTPPFYLPAGQELTIPITTYTGSTTTQHVHPTILKFTTKINGYNYILGITPYPNGDSSYENPSIAFTNDLINYYEDGVSNPLVPPPSSGWNADPDLTYDPIRNRLLYYFIFVRTPEGEGITTLTSTDGVNWSVAGKWYSGTTAWVIASPTVIYDPADGLFKMWAIKYDRTTYEKTLVYATSTDGVNFTDFQALSYNHPYYGGQYYSAWHIAVHKVGDEYWMIAAANPVGLADGSAPVHLFFANSTDGINWTFYDDPILDTATSLATNKLYRADFLVDNGTLYVLYSYQNSDGTWHVALTSTDVSAIVGNVSSDNVVTPKLIEFNPKTLSLKVKVFSELNFSAKLSSTLNCTWYINNEPVKTENSTSPSLNITFNESGIYTIMLKIDEIVVKWTVEVYKPTPMFKLSAPISVQIEKSTNLTIHLENLDELFDYEIEIDLNNDGIPDITTKDLNITLPAFLRPAKYKITVSVKDPVTGAINKSEFYLQVYAFKLFKGYNVINTTGAVILADSTEPAYVKIKPIKVTKEFTVVVSEENIYANNTSEVILNVTFIGLAGGDKIWLNETIAKAISVDLLHNGEPMLTAIPVENGSVNLTISEFSTYTLVVNNTQLPPKNNVQQPTSNILPIVLVAVFGICIVLVLGYVLKWKKTIAKITLEQEFKFFRRLK